MLPTRQLRPRPPQGRAGWGWAPGVPWPGGLHPPLTIFPNTQLHPLRILRMQTPPWDLANSLKTRPELNWASRLISARLFQGRKFSENVLLGVEVQLLPAFLRITPPPLPGPSSFTPAPPHPLPRPPLYRGGLGPGDPAAGESPRWESGQLSWVPPHKSYQFQMEVQCGVWAILAHMAGHSRFCKDMRSSVSVTTVSPGFSPVSCFFARGSCFH